MKRQDFYFALTCLLGLPPIFIGGVIGVFTLTALLVLITFGVLTSASLLITRSRFPGFFSSHGRFVCHIVAGVTVVALGLTYTADGVKFILISVLIVVCFNLFLEHEGIQTAFDFRQGRFTKSYYRSAAAWLLGVLLVIVFFPLREALAATLILTVGDPAASLAGRRFTSAQVMGPRKTWQGSLAFLVFSFLAGSLLVPYVQSFVASLVGMCVELLSVQIDDNLTVPISAAFALFAISFG